MVLRRQRRPRRSGDRGGRRKVIAKARWRHLGTSPQKVRLVVDQIRGKPVGEALSFLRFSSKMAARDVEKVLKSAVANAEQREERVDVDLLRVSRAYVDPGPTAKRVRFRAMGRIFRINKRSCHVTLELDVKSRPGAMATPALEGPRVTRKRASLTDGKTRVRASDSAGRGQKGPRKKKATGTAAKRAVRRPAASKKASASKKKKAGKKAGKKTGK